MSPEMKAVLEIVNSTDQLQHDLLPILRASSEEVYFSLLDHRGLSGGVQTSLSWIFAMWADKLHPEYADPFWNFGSLNRATQRAIVRAIQIKYGL